MYLLEQIIRILSDMMKNKLRVFLTMLGIIVGISSVVLIISVGFTATDVVQMYFSGSLGDNRITTYVSEKNGKDFNFSYNEVYELADKLPMVKGPLFECDTTIEGKAVVDEERYSLATLKGVSYVYLDAHQLMMAAGRFLSKSDCKYSSSAAVISNVAAENCFGSVNDALGNTIRIMGNEGKLVELTVVGVYQTVDTTGKLDKLNDKRTWSTDVYCTYEFYNSETNVATEELKYSEVTYITPTDVNVDEAVMITEGVMAERSDDPDYSFSCYRGYALVDQTNSVLSMLMLVFIAAASLSLIVGGISLMNTMLVTVKERTREIGTRKALGASDSSIVFQFLLESVIICLMACVIGIGLCAILMVILQQNLDVFIDLVSDDALRNFLKNSNVTLSMNMIAVVVSALFSTVVGVLFGVYPAMKAAKMQVTDALRYE